MLIYTQLLGSHLTFQVENILLHISLFFSFKLCVNPSMVYLNFFVDFTWCRISGMIWFFSISYLLKQRKTRMSWSSSLNCVRFSIYLNTSFGWLSCMHKIFSDEKSTSVFRFNLGSFSRLKFRSKVTNPAFTKILPAM